jgi:hypothetical protein
MYLDLAAYMHIVLTQLGDWITVIIFFSYPFKTGILYNIPFDATGIVPSIFSLVGRCYVFLLAHKYLPATISVQGAFVHMFQPFYSVLFYVF